MEHADTAQLAALGGALGAVLVLLASGRAARVLLLAGLALLAATELTLAWALGGGVFERLSGASGAAALVLGLAAVAVAAAAFVRWPAVVPIAVLVTAPLRPPLSFDSSSSTVSNGGVPAPSGAFCGRSGKYTLPSGETTAGGGWPAPATVQTLVVGS